MASLTGRKQRQRREVLLGGMDEHANPLIGTPFACQNINQVKRGEWRVRGGWALTGDTLDTTEDATAIQSFRNELYGFGPQYVQHADGGILDHAPEFTLIKDVGITSGNNATVLATDIAYYNGYFFQACVIYKGDNSVEVRVSQYTLSEDGFAKVIHDHLLATGSAGDIRGVQVAARSNVGVVVVYDFNATLRAASFATLASVPSTVELEDDFLDPASAGMFYMIADADVFYVAYTATDSDNHLALAAYSQAGGVGTTIVNFWQVTVATTFNDIEGISLDQDGTDIWVMWLDRTGTDAGDVRMARILATNGTESLGDTQIATLASQASGFYVGECSIKVLDSGEAVVVYGEEPDLAENNEYVPWLQILKVDSDGSELSKRHTFRARPASQIFLQNDRVYAYALILDRTRWAADAGVADAEDTDPDVGTGVSLPLNTYVLLDLRSGDEADEITDADTEAGGVRLVGIVEYNSAWYATGPRNCVSKVATGHATYGWVTSLPLLKLPLIRPGTVSVNRVDTVLYGVRANDTALYRGVEIGKNLCLPGSLPSYFDGAEVHEFGFAQVPEILTVVQSGGTAVADSNFQQQASPTPVPTNQQLAQQIASQINIAVPAPPQQVQVQGQGVVTTGFRYSFKACFIARDNNGNEYRSAFGNTVTIYTDTALTSEDAVLTVSTLNYTNRQDLENSWKDNVGIEIYRTTLVTDEGGNVLQGTLFHLLRTVTNDPREQYITVQTSSLETDARVQERRIAYTDSDELEPAPPPSARWAIARFNRLLLFGTPGQRDFWYSKEYIQDRGLQFVDTFVVRVDDDAGRITGGRVHNGRLLGLGRDKMFYLDGQFPDDTGFGNSLGELTLITSTVGCAACHLSVATEHGLITYTNSGFYIIDHSGKDNYLSGPVEDTLAAFPVINWLHKERGTQFVFIAVQNTAGTAGRVLRFDLLHGSWSIDTGFAFLPKSIAQTDAGMQLLDDDAALRLETDGAGDEASSNPVVGLWDSGWIAPAGLNAWYQADEFLLLFQPRAFSEGTSSVIVRRYINFQGATGSDLWQEDTTTGQNGMGINVRYTPNPSQVQSERYQVSVVQTNSGTQSAEPARLSAMRLVYWPLSETLLPEARKAF